MLRKIVCIFLLLFMTVSLSAQKWMEKKMNRDSVADVQLIYVKPYVYAVEKSGSLYQDSLSDAAAENLYKQIRDSLGLSFSYRTIIADSLERAALFEEVWSFYNQVLYQRNDDDSDEIYRKKKKDAEPEEAMSVRHYLPMRMDSLTTLSETRYSMFICAKGFVMSAQEYTKQVVLGVMASFVSLGAVYYIPYKAGNEVTVLLVDNDTGQLLYRNRNFAEISPVDTERVCLQLKRLFKKF